MKAKLFLFVALFLAAALSSLAGIKTVSNNPTSPGQYNDLQAAINAAGLNDTIMIAGSVTSYGNVTISKPLVLVGAGYNNPYGQNTTVGTISLTRTSQFLSGSGTKIMGLNCSVLLNGNYGAALASLNSLDNVIIERCLLSSVTFNSNSNNYYSNDTIRNCIINSSLSFVTVGYQIFLNNIYIHNNIFNGSNISSFALNNLSTVYVRNNIFINRSTAVFSSAVNLILENNIFYGAGADPNGCTNCAFTKNISFLSPILPGTGNVGSGNLNATNPMFVNYPSGGGAFQYIYDFHLQPGSPGKNAGTDGTDIGIYGGMLPFIVGANPHFPQMMELTLPNGSSVPAGGTLNVHFKARKQN